MSTINEKSSKSWGVAFKITFTVSFQSTSKTGDRKTEFEVHELFEAPLSIQKKLQEMMKLSQKM